MRCLNINASFKNCPFKNVRINYSPSLSTSIHCLQPYSRSQWLLESIHGLARTSSPDPPADCTLQETIYTPPPPVTSTLSFTAEQLKRLQGGKAVGPDGVSSRALKTTSGSPFSLTTGHWCCTGVLDYGVPDWQTIAHAPIVLYASQSDQQHRSSTGHHPLSLPLHSTPLT